MTETASAANSAVMISRGNSTGGPVAMAAAPRAPPSAREPVSPMNIIALLWLCVRKPMHAPAMQQQNAATCTHSAVGSTPAPITASARPINAAPEVPAASPSSPSVRFTALLSAVMTNTASGQSSCPRHRCHPPCSDAVIQLGAAPQSANLQYTQATNSEATASCAPIFPRTLTPLLLRWIMLTASSTAPSIAYPAVAAQMATTTGEAWVSRMAAAAPTGTNEIPPIVGVPDFAATCAGGPSSLTTCPALTHCNSGSVARPSAAAPTPLPKYPARKTGLLQSPYRTSSAHAAHAREAAKPTAGKRPALDLAPSLGPTARGDGDDSELHRGSAGRERGIPGLLPVRISKHTLAWRDVRRRAGAHIVGEGDAPRRRDAFAVLDGTRVVVPAWLAIRLTGMVREAMLWSISRSSTRTWTAQPASRLAFFRRQLP
mmetsp:Transcript_2112/g.4280  ORF Transcript_2112/g.4280 Transcript_2112/m.4280 type:complete len:431 (-) Transcript_2112:302-1594(-)